MYPIGSERSPLRASRRYTVTVHRRIRRSDYIECRRAQGGRVGDGGTENQAEWQEQMMEMHFVWGF